jgi:hypothetical protein
MALHSEFVAAPGAQPAISRPPASAEVRQFLRHAVWFVLVGLALYGILYAASERLIFRYARRNRFYMVKTAPYTRYDYVILGASHAAVFDLDDMNTRLETMTKSRILNLSTVGGGITVNRLLLEYFLARHQTTTVVYMLDSFVFNSQQWNGDRLQDVRLFYRAPLDLSLARLLFKNPATRSVALDYVAGFSKINNPKRFEPDTPEEAARFDRTYRPIQQIDQQRIDYLYPRQADEPALRSRYLAEFEDLIRYMKSRQIRLLVIQPPIPERVYRMIPDEGSFNAALKGILDRQGVASYDFSLVGNDEQFFSDTDHLNRTGVLNFFQNYLQGALTSDAPGQ